MSITRKEAGGLKKGDYAIMKDRPVKILSTSHCKTGKHGAGKNNFSALDVFTGKKIMTSMPSYSLVDVPEIKSATYVVTNVEDNTLDVLDDDNEEHPNFIDVEDGEYMEKIQKLFDDDKEVLVTILEGMGEKKVTDVKEGEE